MMMLPDKKKMVSVIVEKMKPEMPKMEEVEKEQPESDYQLAKEDSAKKMIEAFQKKDAKMLALHLQDFLDMCESCSEESDD